MNRYHIKTGFLPQDIKGLNDFTSRLNNLQWHYTSHSIDSVKDRAIDLEGLLLFVRDIELSFNQIFEYYSDGDFIKICYRINYNKLQDIILVLTPEKMIITIYINAVEDNHITLKKELYQRG